MAIDKSKIARQQQRLLLLKQARNRYREHIVALTEIGAVLEDVKEAFQKEAVDNEEYLDADIKELRKKSPLYDLLNGFLLSTQAVAAIAENIDELNNLPIKYELTDRDFLSTHMAKIGFEKDTPEDISGIDIQSLIKRFKKDAQVITKYYDIGFYLVKPSDKRIEDGICIRSSSRPEAIAIKFASAIKQAKYEKFAAIHFSIKGYRGKYGTGSGEISYHKKNVSGSVTTYYTHVLINPEPVWVNQDADVLSDYLMDKI